MNTIANEYPLLQVLEIKKRRVTEAEKVVREKRELRDKEVEKLREAEAARDKVLNHRNEKLAQLRAEMDQDTNTVKIRQMKDYLDVVVERLEKEEKKVEEQQKQVDKAQQALDEAKEELRLKRLEVDKLNMHKDEWMAKRREELKIEEGKVMDEVGQITYQLQRQLRGK